MSSFLEVRFMWRPMTGNGRFLGNAEDWNKVVVVVQSIKCVMGRDGS